MGIQFYCPRWGSEGYDWLSLMTRAANAGYDGLEVAIGRNMHSGELDELFNTAEQCHMKIIAQHFDTTEAEFNAHTDQFCRWLDKMNDYCPVKIDSQTGRDFFSFQENFSLFSIASDFTKRTGVQVCHETHRNKALFAAHISRPYLEMVPDLSITLDASHWVCVAESLLEDQKNTMQLAIGKTAHIHARVGYPEGPQVPDPRMPEYKDTLQAHLVWWDAVAERFAAEGRVLTVTPEFGPFPYMVSLPYNGMPIANQWDINIYMMRLLKQRFSLIDTYEYSA
ncbi:sugar phosphate isomerase/epimerase family protein [Pedobacter sp. PWIIR3]